MSENKFGKFNLKEFLANKFNTNDFKKDKAVKSNLKEFLASKFNANNLKKEKKRIVISTVAVVLVVAVVVYAFGSGGTAQASDKYTNYTVETRNIIQSLSGTGTLEPADSYTVTTLIDGDITSAPFEEGDVVEKGAVLYQFGSSNVTTSIEQAQVSVSQSQRSYNQQVKNLDDLKIKSNESGEVIDIPVKVGDTVTAGQTVAQIRNSSVMSLEIPFSSDDAASLYVGQSAVVTLEGSFEQLTGTISKISAVEERLDGNMLVRKVTIDVSNPGGIAQGQTATAMVGSIACNSSGTFSYKGESTVTATVGGDVSAIHVKEGNTVTKNQIIITLSNDTLTNEVANSSDSLRNSQLSLESKYDQLADYTITSPIAGTIIEKNYKEGDTLESGNPLCVIFDLSYLTMTLNVDELDVSEIEVGQMVIITAEALDGQIYEGYVTKVNINGTTTNGTTAYPVTIRIDEADGLLPGMNVQASIVVTSKSDVIAVPVTALSRGNLVLMKTDDKTSQSSEDTGLPEGFSYVQVTPGVSDGNFIEITSGLKVGDIIAYTEEEIPTSNRIQFGIGGGPAGGGPGGGQTPSAPRDSGGMGSSGGMGGGGSQ